MSRSIGIDEIREIVEELDLVGLMEEAFVAYSQGRAVVPPVGELVFHDPPGETHIKYGYLRGGDHYVIKVASGFYGNPELGLPSGHGLMLLFSQKTGILDSVLLDEGYLTDIRTAAAGAVAAKHLAPPEVKCMGVLGAGTQAKLQLEYLLGVNPCRKAMVWVPDPAEVESFMNHFSGMDLSIDLAENPGQVAERCRLIVTTTPSRKPLLEAGGVVAGTHITAIGSDTTDKIELAPEILGAADLVVVDSLPQSESRGEVFQAVEAGLLSRDRVIELGALVAGEGGRGSADQITVCDLTGVAVQDLAIATAVGSGAKRTP